MKFTKFYKIALFSLLMANSAIYGAHEVVSKKYSDFTFYEEIAPFNEGFLKVSDLHTIYYAEFGNPKGMPIVIVHGGPGGQCYETWVRMFDPEFYRIVMYDQRGGGRSTPFAEMEENTSQISVDDMENLRKKLLIDKWVLFGGSYGSFLSLLYGEMHPENCSGFILRGICLGREKDYKHLFYGMKQFYPEAFEEMIKDVPEQDRSDLISYFHKQVMNPDPVIHIAAAKAFMKFDTYCAYLVPTMQQIQEVDDDLICTLGVGKAFIHYAANGFFVENNQILNDLHKIAHLPAIIIQGRYDIICPPEGAYELYSDWKNAELWFISDAGHATVEPGISQGLREATDVLKNRI